jgi:hypothetical protein
MQSLQAGVSASLERLKGMIVPNPELQPEAFRDKVSAVDDLMRPYQSRTNNLLNCKRSSQFMAYEQKITRETRKLAYAEIKEVERSLIAIQQEVAKRKKAQNNPPPPTRMADLQAMMMDFEAARIRRQAQQGEFDMDDEMEDELSGEHHMEDDSGEDDEEERPPRNNQEEPDLD